MCDVFAVAVADTSYELLEKVPCLVFCEVHSSLHSIEELATCCILERDPQMCLCQEHLQHMLFTGQLTVWST